MTRRLISITAVAIALPLGVLTAPIWIVLAAAADAVGRLWRFPTVRLGMFGIVYLLHQWAGLGLAAPLILSEKLTGRSRLIDYRDVQLWWAASLLRAARRLLGVDFTVEHDTPLPDHSFALISRHASMIDAVLPSVLIVGRLRRYVHYVLKDDLLWDPAIATYGIRLGNWFVARGSRTEDELEGIAHLARTAQPDSVLVIFPEGTYATATSRRRVQASLAAKAEAGDLAPEVVKYARGLNHLLPPKPAGTLTLLANRPEADVVILGHVGLEGVAQLKGLRRRLPLTHSVVVRWWSYRRDELPQDPDDLEDWLQQRWIELDRWVADTKGGVGVEPV